MRIATALLILFLAVDPVRAAVAVEPPVADSSAASSRPSMPAEAPSLDELLGSFKVAGSVAGFQSAERFSAFLRDPSADSQWSFEGKSWWLVVALVVAGGFLLNLTPCVLPLLPITLSVIGAGSQAGSKRKGLFLGAIYAAGMTLAYGAAGAAVIVSGATFGAVNASPVLNLAVAALFVLLALAMFEVLHIDFTHLRGVLRPGAVHGGTVAGVFALGGLTAILAGACVAPVVISVVVYATALYSGGQSSALLLPFLLGAGMALPWPLAGAGLRFLPKPGAWMVWVRNLFGVAILVVAGWYAYTGVMMLRASTAIPASPAMSASDLEPGWLRTLEEGLGTGLAEGKPVLVDFWATWCKNCHVMDAGPMRDDSVVGELEKFVLVKYQAEDPESEPAQSVLRRFNVIGLPTYVILRPVARTP